MYSGEVCMRQDPLGGDRSDGLNARQLQEVIREEKGSVCRISTCLAVLVMPFPVYSLHHLKHKLWLPASQPLGLLTASVSAVMLLGADKTSLRCTLGLDRRSSS